MKCTDEKRKSREFFTMFHTAGTIRSALAFNWTILALSLSRSIHMRSLSAGLLALPLCWRSREMQRQMHPTRDYELLAANNGHNNTYSPSEITITQTATATTASSKIVRKLIEKSHVGTRTVCVISSQSILVPIDRSDCTYYKHDSGP